MVADKKMTVDSGRAYEYRDKLICDIPDVIIGYSGLSSKFNRFRIKVTNYMEEEFANNKSVPKIGKILDKIGDICLSIRNEYRLSEGFDTLVGISTKKFQQESKDLKSDLRYFDPEGLPEYVNEFKSIGSGAPHGDVILKKIWNKDMSMEEVAEIGYFIIKYIEKLELDLTVAVGLHQPQIWYLPDDKACCQVKDNDILFKEFDRKTILRISKIENDIIDLWKIN
jgi:hypothetical protein